MSETIDTFRIEVGDDVLEDLRSRLRNTRWPEREPVNDWSQGVPLAYMRELCEYWLETYDWRGREAWINTFPQFRTTIDGLGIHFLHVRSPHEKATPLVITHGWPGSVVEFLKVVEPLTRPEKHGGDPSDAVHLVCPSMPGFGFSDKPAEPGWTAERIADAWSVLMRRLGYDRYLAQGGDWGAIVTAAIGARDAQHCMGIHMNMPVVALAPDPDAPLTEQEQGALARMQHYQEEDSGYSKQQSTRPQTVGYALVDSPVGQAAWILDKFWSWTDSDGHPENVLSRDELLDNIMMYWLPAAGASSARLYWESFSTIMRQLAGECDEVPGYHVDIPVGGSIFPKEIIRPSRRWAARRFRNIVHWNHLDRGGHFAALEQPELFVNELRACFRAMRGGVEADPDTAEMRKPAQKAVRAADLRD